MKKIERYKYITAFNGKAYFESETGKRLEKKVYKTPKKIANGGLLGNYYIIHNNEKIYFNSNFIRILTK